MSQLLATLDRLTVPAAIVLALVAVALWAIGLLFSSMAAGDALIVALAAAGLAGHLTGPLLHHLVHAPRHRGAWTTRAPVADTDEGPRARTAPTDKESRVSNQSNGLTAAISAVRRLLAAGWESDTVHKVYDGVVGDRIVLRASTALSGAREWRCGGGCPPPPLDTPATWQIVFHRVGSAHVVPTLWVRTTATGDELADELSAAVHRHIRHRLEPAHYAVHVDPEAGWGWIDGGLLGHFGVQLVAGGDR